MKHLLICPSCGTKYEAEDLTGTEGLGFMFECSECGDSWSFHDAYSKEFIEKIKEKIANIETQIENKMSRKDSLSIALILFGVMLLIGVVSFGLHVGNEHSSFDGLVTVCGVFVSFSIIIFGATKQTTNEVSDLTDKESKDMLEEKRQLQDYLNDREMLKKELDIDLWTNMYLNPHNRLIELNSELKKLNEKMMDCNSAMLKLKFATYITDNEEAAKAEIKRYLNNGSQRIVEIQFEKDYLEKKIQSYVAL